MTGTIVLSSATIISLLCDINRLRNEADEAIQKITYTHLVAMLYVLKDPKYKNQFKKFKEETTMKKINMSNRTKVILAVTAAFGIAAIASAIGDSKEIAAIENDDDLVIIDMEPVAEAIEEAADAVAELGE